MLWQQKNTCFKQGKFCLTNRTLLDAGLPYGGMLADDQGLGKTVTTLALIVTNQPHLCQEEEEEEDLDEPLSQVWMLVLLNP